VGSPHVRVGHRQALNKREAVPARERLFFAKIPDPELGVVLTNQVAGIPSITHRLLLNRIGGRFFRGRRYIVRNNCVAHI